jgi:hypothetical protein
VLRNDHLIKLGQDLLSNFARNSGNVGDRAPNPLNFLLIQLAENFGTGLLTENNHQNGRLMHASQLIGRYQRSWSCGKRHFLYLLRIR